MSIRMILYLKPEVTIRDCCCTGVNHKTGKYMTVIKWNFYCPDKRGMDARLSFFIRVNDQNTQHCLGYRNE